MWECTVLYGACARGVFPYSTPQDSISDFKVLHIIMYISFIDARSTYILHIYTKLTWLRQVGGEQHLHTVVHTRCNPLNRVEYVQ